MKKKKFTVTTAHIKKAIKESTNRANESSCPIAQCLTEAYPDASNVFVLEGGDVEIRFPTGTLKGKLQNTLSQSAQRFVRDFDKSKPVEAFSFYLRVA